MARSGVRPSVCCEPQLDETVWRLTRIEKPRLALAILLGVLAGTAMLVPPIAIFVPLVLGGLVPLLAISWSRWERALVAVVIVATSVLVVEPWLRHAEPVDGRFMLLSTGGVPSIRDGLAFG